MRQQLGPLPALLQECHHGLRHAQRRGRGVVVVLARREALGLVATMPHQVADGPLQEVAPDRDALGRLIAVHGLHQAAVAVEVLDPIAFEDQRHTPLVHHGAAMGHRGSGGLLGLVLRQRVVHAGGLDGHRQPAREGAYDERDAAPERVSGDHDVAINGEFPHKVQDLAVVPLVVRHIHAFQDAVDSTYDHGCGLPRPDANRGEDCRQDLEGDRLRPHPEILGVVHDARGVGARHSDDGQRPATAAVRACAVASLHLKLQPPALLALAVVGDYANLLVREQHVH
mmetsp:Transcript_72126/g.182392  ORF Transcript_72126/g.182392 Transcript_72126/m.182392 type:complete len:284 (+) Transcript_72126:163-1014(+)